MQYFKDKYLNLRKQLELYTELIKDYDFKTKELTIENTDLKSFIANIYSNLSKASNLNRKDNKAMREKIGIILIEQFDKVYM